MHTPAANKARLLLVDDRQEFLDILGERLRRRGYAVTAVASGEAALEAVGRQEFDAVILDVLMPRMDGLETLSRLRALVPDLPVLILTGYSTAGRAAELGAVEVLVKPTPLETLIERVEATLARRRS